METKAKLIIDPKVRYLIKTLSRTSRKDYENYVINAIWNRLSNNDIEIVSQQCVRKKNGKLYFIDLYFPQLNIGIECDEAYHLGEENKKNDSKREADIYDALYAIGDEEYKTLRIDVSQSFDKIDKRINEIVGVLKDAIKRIKPQKWEIQTAEKYYKNKYKITINDKVGFETMAKACNLLFSTKYANLQKSFFKPATFNNKEWANYKVWFPKFDLPNTKGFNNKLSPDGKTITPSKEKDTSNSQERVKNFNKIKDIKHITFIHSKDPLGVKEYRFVGIFKPHSKGVYKRISDECPLIKNLQQKRSP